MNPPDPYSFSFEPLFVVLPAAAAVLYVRAARREPPSGPKFAAFAVGLVLVVGALNSPLETMATHYLLLIHLLQNVMIADWAPPLLILGLTSAMRAGLVRHGGTAFAAITRARIALPVWLVVWYVIHLAGVYDFALDNPWALDVEHLLLISVGTLFWWPVLGGEPNPLSTLTSLGYLAAGFVGSAFLGLALTFATTPFYDFYAAAPRLWGLSAVKDQNLGGVLMSGEQALVFLLAIGYFVLRLLREEEARERALAGADRR